MSDGSKKNRESPSGLPIGMCLGLAAGAAVGAALHNIGLWMPVGLALGMCFGVAFGQKGADDEHKEDNDKGADL